jgi:hypothetical protein
MGGIEQIPDAAEFRGDDDDDPEDDAEDDPYGFRSSLPAFQRDEDDAEDDPYGFRSSLPAFQRDEDEMEHPCAAFLKDESSHQVYAALWRDEGRLCVNQWHPLNKSLRLMLHPKQATNFADWGVAEVYVDGKRPVFESVERLALQACDYWIGLIQRSTHTCCRIERDDFVA